jgi:3',5'-cyclic AMP phosphodiesterase CpdA
VDEPGLTILHTSDWQCGEPYLPHAADAMLRVASKVEPAVIVASGDLTQRAKPREYRTAVDLLGRLPPVPVVTTPGNHDVPLYRFWERLIAPFRNWRRFIREDLDTVTRLAGATFVALNSAAPRRAIVNGRLYARQLEFASRAFDQAPEGDVRCLVVHHHFVPVPDGEGGETLPDAPRWLRMIEAAGVDLILGGHVHQTHLSSSRSVLPDGEGPGVPVLACGTTTSRRGRGEEVESNSLNVVRVTESAVEIMPYHLRPGEKEFVEGESVVMPRPWTRPVDDSRPADAETGEVA